MRASFALLFMVFPMTAALAEPRPQDDQAVTLGPWSIATNYKTDKFESCTINRSAGELRITFVRGQDGLLVLLDSPKWKLARGKAYPVRLIAGTRSVDAQALADAKSVTIALEDFELEFESPDGQCFRGARRRRNAAYTAGRECGGFRAAREMLRQTRDGRNKSLRGAQPKTLGIVAFDLAVGVTYEIVR